MWTTEVGKKKSVVRTQLSQYCSSAFEIPEASMILGISYGFECQDVDEWGPFQPM